MRALLLSSLLLFGVVTTSSAGKHSQVATRLTQAIAEERLTQNIVFSPADIQHILAYMYLGAEGKTAAQLRKSLKLAKSKEKMVEKCNKMYNKHLANKKIEFDMETRLHLDKGLKVTKSFKDYAKSFNASISQVPCSNCTSFNTDLHFKAEWRHKFKKQKPDKGFMTQEDSMLFKDFDSLGAYAVQVKLKHTKISMLFIKPKADSGGLPALVSKLKSVDLTQMPKDMQKTKITLTAPRFFIKYDTFLKSALGKLGIRSLFKNAPFNNILAGNEPLTFPKIGDRTVIRVDEKGVGVWSQTGTNKYKLPPLEEVDGEADHSLFFAVIDKKNVYFAGHVAGSPLNIDFMKPRMPE